MPSAERTIVIDRPPDQVFGFFADPANDRAWRSHVKEIAALGPAGIGATVHQVIEGPGGRGLAADLEITAYDPPTRYHGLRSADPLRLSRDRRPGSADRRVPVRSVGHRHRGDVLAAGRSRVPQGTCVVAPRAELDGRRDGGARSSKGLDRGSLRRLTRAALALRRHPPASRASDRWHPSIHARPVAAVLALGRGSPTRRRFGAEPRVTGEARLRDGDSVPNRG
jgi:hypothetical protein